MSLPRTILRPRRWPPQEAFSGLGPGWGPVGAPVRRGTGPRYRDARDAPESAALPSGKTFESWREEDSSIPLVTPDKLGSPARWQGATFPSPARRARGSTAECACAPHSS